MKHKKAMVLVGLLFIFAPLAHAQASFNQNLYYGMEGNSDVVALQQFLTAQGDYTGPITGSFYSLTMTGVKKFQSSYALPATGYFGVLSRAAANALLNKAIINAQHEADEEASTTQALSGQASSTQAFTQASSTVGVPGNAPSSQGQVSGQEGITQGSGQTDSTSTQSLAQSQVVAPTPLIVPDCEITAKLSPSGARGTTGQWTVYFGWVMNPKATGIISGAGTLPSYTSHVAHPPIVSAIQRVPVATYTLTETMALPAYQEITTCTVTADTANSL